MSLVTTINLVNKGKRRDRTTLTVVDNWPLLASVTCCGSYILKCQYITILYIQQYFYFGHI